MLENMPIMSFQISSMKHEILKCLDSHSQEMENIIRNTVEEFFEEDKVEAVIKTQLKAQLDYTLSEVIKDVAADLLKCDEVIYRKIKNLVGRSIAEKLLEEKK